MSKAMETAIKTSKTICNFFILKNSLQS